VEVRDIDSAVAPVEPVVPVEPATTWRAALSAWVRPSGHHVSDEDIFAILNGGSDGEAADELCAARGVTVPMYCVWKSKYRKLDLDQLRQARRVEHRRRHTVIGLVLLTVVLLTGGIGASLVWAVSSTFKDEPAAAAPVASVLKPIPAPATNAPSPVPDPAPATVETGYRIQVTAAETEQQGVALVTRLKSQGYPAYLMPAVVGNRDVFRVRVGSFDTLPAAQEVAARLKSAGYSGAWIAR
jgi:hypothetical protein